MEWGTFNLKELFGKSTRGKRLKSEDRISGTLPFVTAGEKDEGISAFIGNDVTVFSENTITIDMFGSAKYRNYKYGCDDHIAVVHTESLPKPVAIFITSAIHKKSYTGEFHYGRNFYAKDADTLNISLPIKNGKIDFEFMESFIAELEAERIAKLEAYLLATGLKDYILTAEEKQVLDDFEKDKIKWGEFKIGDLLDKLELKTLKKPFDKLSDTSNAQTDEFNLPLVNAKLGNNGIMFYGREKDFDTAEMTIDVISNGAIATGTVYTQPYKTGILWDAYLLRPRVINISKNKLLFFTTSLEKSIKTKFGWDNKAVWSKVQHELISLPRQDKQPNYAVMETLISAIQKLVIKEVVLYADRKIAATKTVVNK
ncbi:restriction enzyme BgcI subunit beta [Planktothrix agardhii CCAP 1459/11A]|uniref:Restriction enzyme BgcI subunit beta n=1 Tax=Planktothrix agardhii CCAP 1459/11A TaxID=282420 RepID=A0A4P5ZE09_PLAAG|nr:restriction endonuclease subunit S [Planktothrix agardhii]GDZ93733.1 restriction enzyme BgcI subunit beta [Planktothrix agardhii CCAP 1459/11A]